MKSTVLNTVLVTVDERKQSSNVLACWNKKGDYYPGLFNTPQGRRHITVVEHCHPITPPPSEHPRRGFRLLRVESSESQPRPDSTLTHVCMAFVDKIAAMTRSSYVWGPAQQSPELTLKICCVISILWRVEAAMSITTAGDYKTSAP